MIDLHWLIAFLWANLIFTIILVVGAFVGAFVWGLVYALWQGWKHLEGNHEDFDNDK